MKQNNTRRWTRYLVSLLALLLLGGTSVAQRASTSSPDELGDDDGEDLRRLLYVAGEGSESGISVYDIERGHELVEKIDYGGGDAKGIAASAATETLYVSSHWRDEVVCYDLVEEEVVWRNQYGDYADRLDVTPNGEWLYAPLREDGVWVVADAETGREVARIEVPGRPHNTLIGPNGKHACLSALDNPTLYVADVQTREIIRTVGPFSSGLRPFTIDPERSLAFVNTNGLLGFEMGNVETGQTGRRVEVENYPYPEESYHNTPSHGIALTPDGEEVWVVNASGYLHVFDATQDPPKQEATIEVHGDPGWITFSIEGRYAYAATGDVVNTRTRRIVARVESSEKMLEIDFTEEGRVARVGHQFGFATRRGTLQR